MKIVVISDTHGRLDKTFLALHKINNIHLILHLGDYVKDAREIEKTMNIETVYVRGNCDYLDDDVEEEKILEIEGKKIFMTHGHKYDVKRGVNKVFYRGKELDADIILFGHSHIAMTVEYEDILLFNPGSPGTPRGGDEGSIGIIEILDEKIEEQIILV